MDIDYFYFVTQRERNAAWNLLRANHAPLIFTLVHEGFVKQGRTSAPESELLECLKDIIFRLKQSSAAQVIFDPLEHSEFYASVLSSSDATTSTSSASINSQEAEDEAKDFVKPNANSKAANYIDNPIYYLRQWSSEKTRYFRCSYMGSSGTEPLYDITPELQKAYSFIVGMKDRNSNFIPTESRFKELLDILKEVQLSTGGDVQAYLDELLAQRAELDAKIAKAKRGEVSLLSPAQIRERFLQFQHDALELTDDFRQVEYNLANLDKEIMQDIINWTGPRGELLDKYFEQNAYIEDSDQGRSVKAFSSLLLSGSADEAIVNRIEHLLSLKELVGLAKDERLHNIHDQWLALRMNIERVMGASTKRIKSFLQPANLDANRFLKERIKSICDQVVALTKDSGLEDLPDELIELEVPKAALNLAFDRPLASVSEALEFNTQTRQDDFTVVDDKLFEQVVIDPLRLYGHIDHMLQDRDSIGLQEIVSKFPLEHGISELTTYVKLAMLDYDLELDPTQEDEFRWEALDADGNTVVRTAKLQHCILKRR